MFATGRIRPILTAIQMKLVANQMSSEDGETAAGVNRSSLNQRKDKQVLIVLEEARELLSHPVLSGSGLTDSRNQS